MDLVLIDEKSNKVDKDKMASSITQYFAPGTPKEAIANWCEDSRRYWSENFENSEDQYPHNLQSSMITHYTIMVSVFRG